MPPSQIPCATEQGISKRVSGNLFVEPGNFQANAGHEFGWAHHVVRKGDLLWLATRPNMKIWRYRTRTVAASKPISDPQPRIHVIKNDG
jgi:hypothetical protein